MYTQYAVAQVVSATCEVTVWSGVSGQDEPFRIIIIPCLAADYTVYSGYSNVAALASVPHAVQGVFSPGGVMPKVTAKGSNSTMLSGIAKEYPDVESIANDYTQQSGGDPGFLWYFLVGYQNFAGTTTTNQQAQVKLTFKVKWFRPIATAEQSVSCDYFGNEHVTPSVVNRLRRIAQLGRGLALPAPPSGGGERKSSELVESKSTSAGSAAGSWEHESLDSVDDDAAELEMLRKYKNVFLAGASQVGAGLGLATGAGAAAATGQPKAGGSSKGSGR